MQENNYLKEAVELAKRSPERIGCGVVIVSNGIVIAKASNSQRTDNMAVNHAEVKAVNEANKKTGTRKLPNATAYCSCEPCAMCLVALSYAGIERIVFNRSMKDLFPDDPQSNFDSQDFVKGLNTVPVLQQMEILPEHL